VSDEPRFPIVLTPLAEKAIEESQELTDLFDDVIVKIKFEKLTRTEQFQQLFRILNHRRNR
jgi:pyruvate-formate lyase